MKREEIMMLSVFKICYEKLINYAILFSGTISKVFQILKLFNKFISFPLIYLTVTSSTRIELSQCPASLYSECSI